jgi:hypothetical protein
VHATDGLIGHVEDCMVDDGGWSIRYFIVKARHGQPVQRVLVSPKWITKTGWSEKHIFVNLTREAVWSSPLFNPATPIGPDFEGSLLAHLQKPEDAEWVVFKFDAPPGADVHVAGTFNNWDPTAIRLGDNHKGTYTATVLLPPARYEYKFIVNGDWLNGPDCHEHIPNAFGTMNTLLDVGRTATRNGHLHTFARQPHNDNRPMWGAPSGRQ